MTATQLITALHIETVTKLGDDHGACIVVRVHDNGYILVSAQNMEGVLGNDPRSKGVVHLDCIPRAVVLEYLKEFGDDITGRTATAAIMSGLVTEHIDHRAERTEGLYSALLRALNTNE